MRTRSYYLHRRTRWDRLTGWVHTRVLRRPAPDFTGWTARATSDRDVPAGTEGTVVASRLNGGQLVHVIDFRPRLMLHVPLPWPGIELREP